jgi:hypothetical protein
MISVKIKQNFRDESGALEILHFHGVTNNNIKFSNFRHYDGYLHLAASSARLGYDIKRSDLTRGVSNVAWARYE